MRRLLVLVALLLATAGFVPPTLDQQASIEGTWNAAGTHPDGSTYVGKATIVRLGGNGPGRERYEITFHMANGTFRAICLRAREVLGCGWGSRNTLGVGLYRRIPGGLDGTWFRDGDDEVGREQCSAPPDLGLSGELTTSGTTPNGQAYSGAMTIGGSGDVHPVGFRRGTTTLRGYGITHSGPSGAWFVTGFPAHECGTAIYVVGASGAGSITARWMDFNTPTLGLGTETLTRAP